jgi:signal transduction histidine kinase
VVCAGLSTHVPKVTTPIHDFWHPRTASRSPYNLAMGAETSSESAPCHVPAVVDSPSMTPAANRLFQWFNLAAIATWLACGLWPLSAVATGQFTGAPALVYVAAFLLYGVMLAAILTLPHRIDARTAFILVLVATTVTAIGLNWLTVAYLNGTGVGLGLLALVAASLPYFIGATSTWLWIVAQTAALFVVIRTDLTAVDGVTFALAATGFQVFLAASSMLAINEARARSNFARVNAELTATRDLLAESSRTAERLRISRDLHDTLGHHLAALSLQLDVASRLSEGKVAEHVQRAHAITRLLLSDVRSVVSSLRDSSRLNLAESIRALIRQPLDASVHLTQPDALIVEDPARAEALLRAVQEILTNTTRHAHARNLWIDLAEVDGGVVLTSRDDGHGTDAIVPGNGLNGMKERFEEQGGRVEIHSGRGDGFHVRAFLPLPSSA